jgi:dTDP-glucose 4,6-dehydratase
MACPREHSLPPADVQVVVDRMAAHWQALDGARVLVTGGTGFVGSWIVASFLAANAQRGLGARITLLSRDPPGFARRHPALGTAKGGRFVLG